MREWKTVLVWFLAVLFVVVFTIGCAYLGLLSGYLLNQNSQGIMLTGIVLGAVVGLGLAIVLVIAIRNLRDWWISR